MNCGFKWHRSWLHLGVKLSSNIKSDKTKGTGRVPIIHGNQGEGQGDVMADDKRCPFASVLPRWGGTECGTRPSPLLQEGNQSSCRCWLGRLTGHQASRMLRIWMAFMVYCTHFHIIRATKAGRDSLVSRKRFSVLCKDSLCLRSSCSLPGGFLLSRYQLEHVHMLKSQTLC